MRTRVMSSALRFGLGLAMLVGSAGSAQAGPPLICHPFQTGGAPSLPWGQGRAWNNPDGQYDTRRLTADTLRLLTPSAPILARMETMRRATIYASKDPRAANELLAQLLGRALNATAEGKADALAWFDAGYLVETYRQGAHVFRSDMLPNAQRASWSLRDDLAGLDGYAWVRRALATAATPDMEFAASLMKDGTVSQQHFRNAVAGVRDGSLLARQLVETGQVTTFAELQAKFGSHR
jgi:hypothetical protein